MKLLRYVVFKGGIRENRVYIAIAILVIIVIILGVIFSTNQLKKAYIPDQILGDFWSEDKDERTAGSQLFGLEKWQSYTYRNNNDTYSAYVTVTSIKTLFMMNENDLKAETIKTINKASDQGIVIDKNPQISGCRATRGGGHKTYYIVYDGNDTSEEPYEKVKIIGEYWNCVSSRTSIICIGVAWITDNIHNNSEIITTEWAKIVGDEEGTFGEGEYKVNNGLIFNVKCH